MDLGRENDAIIERDDNWLMKAQSEGWSCAVCGNTPPYDEREVFFETGMCGYCAHVAAKDD